MVLRLIKYMIIAIAMMDKRKEIKIAASEKDVAAASFP
jgi:hypothetical protein